MRTPLAVGYIYLLDLWLIFADYLTRKASGGVISDVIELRGWLGKGALLAAVSFAAYRIGALNIISPTILLKQILTLRLRVSDRFGPFAEPLPRSFSAALWDLARRQGFGGKFISTSKIQSVAGEAVAQRYDLRIKLLIADKEVYGEYDRLESEAEFRLNVSIPLAVLFGLLAWKWNLLWLLGLVPVTMIFWQGTTREFEALAVLIRAILVDKIRASEAPEISTT